MPSIIWYLIGIALILLPFAAMLFLPAARSRPILLVYFVIFVLFMYGPMITMAVLSFQGTSGSMTLPAKELFSFHWFSELGADNSTMASVRDGIGKSLWLSAIVAVITAELSFWMFVIERVSCRLCLIPTQRKPLPRLTACAANTC